MTAPPPYEPGSRSDFDRLYRDSYPRLLRTLSGVLGDYAAAEDCVQDAFVRAFAAWHRFRPDRPAEAWLHQIALNCAISHRRKMRIRQVGEVLRRFGHPGVAPDASGHAVESDVVKALAALPPKVSAAFVLRHYHGYTNREIAQSTGVSERMVGLRLNQARASLVAALGSRWNESLPTPGPSCVVPSMEGADA